MPIGVCQAHIFGYQGGGLLADHNRWCVGAGIQRSRHDRSVGNAQSLYPNNT